MSDDIAQDVSRLCIQSAGVVQSADGIQGASAVPPARASRSLLERCTTRWVMLLGAWMALWVGSVTADVTGSSDYAQFQRFPGSVIVSYHVDEATVYTLPLGRMQRVTGSVAPSESQRLQGSLRRITYEIPEGFSGQEVYNYFRGQLLSGDQRELFACQGRGCGSSNFWANDVFNNRILYGPEPTQFYMASTYRSIADGADVDGYAALYVVTRGNRRMYAHLDFLETVAAQGGERVGGADTMWLRLEEEGAVSIPGLAFNEDDQLIDDAGIQAVQELMADQAALQVYVVGHLQGSDDLDSLLQRSRSRAAQVVARLLDAGVDAQRVEAQGVGPLAPYCRSGPCAQRIELVKR